MVTTGGGYSDADLERAANNTDDSESGSESSSSGDVPVNTPDVPDVPDDDGTSGGSGGGSSGGSSGGGGGVPVNTPADDPSMPGDVPDSGSGGTSSGGSGGSSGGGSSSGSSGGGSSGGSSGGSFNDNPDEHADPMPEEGSEEDTRRDRLKHLEDEGVDTSGVQDVETRKIGDIENLSPGDVEGADSPSDEVLIPIYSPRHRVTEGTDLRSGEIRRFKRNSNGELVPILTDEALKERAAEQARSQSDDVQASGALEGQGPMNTIYNAQHADILASVGGGDIDVQERNGQQVPTLDEETEAEIARFRAASDIPGFGPEDFQVRGNKVVLSSDAYRDRVAEEQDVDPDRVSVSRQQDQYVASVQPEATEEENGVVDVSVETNFDQLLHTDKDDPVVDVGVETRRPDAVDELVTGARNAEAEDLVPNRVKIAAGAAGFLAKNPEMAGRVAGAAADGAQDRATDFYASRQNQDYDTNTEVVDPDAIGVMEGAVGTLLSGDYFDPGAASPSSEGGAATGRAAEETADTVRDANASDVGGAAAGSVTTTPEDDQGLDTNMEVVDPGAAGAVEDVGGALVSGDYFNPGAASPSSEGGAATGRAAEETVDAAPGTASRIGSFLSDINQDVNAAEDELASGLPQGLDAGPRGAPEQAGLGLVAGAGYRNRPANPVGVLVRRSPVGAPSRGAARGAAKILGGIGLLAGGAVAVDEFQDRRDDPTAETRTTTQVGISDQASSTEIGLGELTSTNELDVGEDTTSVNEVEPTGDTVSSTEIGLGSGVVETEVETPEGGSSTGDTGGQPAEDGSVVPGDYPLPGRDMPRNPRTDRPEQVDPSDIVETGARTTPWQITQQRQEEEVIDLPAIEEQLRRQRRAEKREVELGDDAVSVPIVEEGGGFISERTFPTGAGAVIGSTVNRVEAAQSSQVTQETESVVEQGDAQTSTQATAAAVDETNAAAQSQGVAADLAMAPELIQESLLQQEVTSETVVVTTQGYEYGTQQEYIQEPVNPTAQAPSNPKGAPFMPDFPGGGRRGSSRRRDDAVSPVFTDFRDPLSGGVLETDRGDSVPAGFGGFL